jgi:ATPase subunit of ABC transporter with duplicated ATPase domains
MDRPSLCLERDKRRRDVGSAGSDCCGEGDGGKLTTDIILSVQAPKIGFDNRSVIKELSFDVSEGENVAIIGPNGAGKTVMLKALLGLLPFRGEIHWSPGVRLGYVPQKVAAASASRPRLSWFQLSFFA